MTVTTVRETERAAWAAYVAGDLERHHQLVEELPNYSHYRFMVYLMNDTLADYIGAPMPARIAALYDY